MLNIKESKEFLLLLIGADALFIALYILFVYGGFLNNFNYSLEKDRGFAEIYQFVKEFWVAAMFFWLFVSERRILYLIWSLLFVYLLIDDSLQLHEKLGEAVANYLGYARMLGVNPEEYGQFTVLVAFGLFFAVLIGIAYVYSADNIKRISRNLILMLVLLSFLGIVVDLIHVMVRDTMFDVTVGIAEDGGELLVMSVICWYVFRLVRRKGNDPPAELSNAQFAADTPRIRERVSEKVA